MNNNYDRRSCPMQQGYPQRPPKPNFTLSPLPADAEVAMAYVPFQTDTRVYDDDKALEVGTLFPCLNKPYLGMGCRKS